MLIYFDYFFILFVVLVFVFADIKKIILCDVEKFESLYFFFVEVSVFCMYWIEVIVESR